MKALLTGNQLSRRNVKTGTDPDASKIDLSPKSATVADISAQKDPAGTLTGRVSPFETSTYRVQATLESIKLMRDGDYYLVLKGGNSETVVEVPDPKDCKGSPLQSQISAARSELEARYHPTKNIQQLHDQATVTGVGFLGFGSSKKAGKHQTGARLMPGLDFNFKQKG
jgi:hypothetical protein